MGFRSFIDKIIKSKTARIDLADTSFWDDIEGDIALQMFSVMIVTDFIAKLISKCDFKVFDRGKEVRGPEWYALNYKPNVNQNASEFWQEVIRKALIEERALIFSVGEQMICADDFSIDKSAVKEWRFYQIYKGTMTFNREYSMSDVLYIRAQNEKSSMLIANIANEYERLLQSAAKKYKLEGGQKGIVEIAGAARGQPDYEKTLTKLLTKDFKTFFSNRNAVLPLFQGYKYVPQNQSGGKTVSEITDYKNIFNDAISKTALIYGVSPALLTGDVAGTKEAFDDTLTRCIDPLAKLLSEELTSKKYTLDEVCKGSKIMCCTNNLKHHDIFDAAQSIDKLLACSLNNVDELRPLVGFEPTGESWAKKHIRTKNYDIVDTGGE